MRSALTAIFVFFFWGAPCIGGEFRRELRHEGGPYARILPAPLVFPAFHEAVRDNPAPLRLDQALSFQSLVNPSFGGNPHGIDVGAAYANGTFGAGLLTETLIGNVSPIKDITLGFSVGTGLFSTGLSISMNDFTAFTPRFTLGLLLGNGLGSHFGVALYELSETMTGAFLRMGYGYLNEGNFNIELFVETPPTATFSGGIFRVGAANAVFIDQWSIGFLTTYGITPAGGFTPGGSAGSSGLEFQIGISKWLSELANLQLRLSADLSATIGLTFAWASP